MRARGARDSSCHFHLSWPSHTRAHYARTPDLLLLAVRDNMSEICATLLWMYRHFHGEPGHLHWTHQPCIYQVTRRMFFLLKPACVKPLVDITAIFETSFPGLAASTVQGGRWSNGQCPACLVTVFPAPPVNRKSLAPARAPEQQKGKTRGGRPNPYEKKTFSIIQLTWLGLPWFSKSRQKCMY